MSKLKRRAAALTEMAAKRGRPVSAKVQATELTKLLKRQLKTRASKRVLAEIAEAGLGYDHLAAMAMADLLLIGEQFERGELSPRDYHSLRPRIYEAARKAMDSFRVHERDTIPGKLTVMTQDAPETLGRIAAYLESRGLSDEAQEIRDLYGPAHTIEAAPWGDELEVD